MVGAGTSAQQPPTPCTDDQATHTALYTYKTGTWTAGPEIPPIASQE